MKGRHIDSFQAQGGADIGATDLPGDTQIAHPTHDSSGRVHVRRWPSGFIQAPLFQQGAWIHIIISPHRTRNPMQLRFSRSDLVHVRAEWRDPNCIDKPVSQVRL